MRRLLKASLAASLCLAVTAMFVPVEKTTAQVRFYAGPGGVGIGYGNTGYGGYGYGYPGYGYRGYRGGNYGFYPSYGNYNQGYRSYYRGNRGLNNYYDGYNGYGYRSYNTPNYYYRNNSNYYAPGGTYTYQASPNYYAAQPARQEDTRPDRPVMGVRIRSASEGVRVVVVQPDSPAAKAGLREGDLITSFNGKRMNTEQALLSELEELDPNTETQLTVRSGDRSWQTSLQLTTYQDAFVNTNDGQRQTVGRPTLDDDLPLPPDPALRENDNPRDTEVPPVDADRNLDTEIDLGVPPTDAADKNNNTPTTPPAPDSGAELETDDSI